MTNIRQILRIPSLTRHLGKMRAPVHARQVKTWMFLLLCSSACNLAHAVKWEKMYEDNIRETFMDTDSIKRNRTHAAVWFRSTFKEKRELSKVDTYQSYMKHRTYHCETGVLVTDKVIAYENPDWTGKIVFQKEYAGSQHEEFDVIPVPVRANTRAAFLKILCPGM